MNDVTRRRALSLAGVGMLPLAGCSEFTGSGDDDPDDPIDADGELPPYASILPTDAQSPYFYGAIDFETMTTITDDEGAESGDEPTDPLIGNPIVVALVCSLGLSQLTNSRGAIPYSDHDDTETGESTLVYVDGVYALVGSYDRDGLETALPDAGYETETTTESHALYTDDETGEVVGITDEVYAFSYPNPNNDNFDPLDAVERTVETAGGIREPKHETDTEFEWLLRAGETDGITLGLYTDDDAFSSGSLERDSDEDDGFEYDFGAFDGASGVHQQLVVADDGASASTLVSYTAEDQVSVDRLESALGADADAVESVQDGSAVILEGEYSGELTD